MRDRGGGVELAAGRGRAVCDLPARGGALRPEAGQQRTGADNGGHHRGRRRSGDRRDAPPAPATVKIYNSGGTDIRPLRLGRQRGVEPGREVHRQLRLGQPGQGDRQLRLCRDQILVRRPPTRVGVEQPLDSGPVGGVEQPGGVIGEPIQIHVVHRAPLPSSPVAAV
jgi:hypothetical protein